MTREIIGFDVPLEYTEELQHEHDEVFDQTARQLGFSVHVLGVWVKMEELGRDLPTEFLLKVFGESNRSFLEEHRIGSITTPEEYSEARRSFLRLYQHSQWPSDGFEEFLKAS